jgi:hypothetical protein
MKFFIDYHKRIIPKLNGIYTNLTFITLNDVLGKEDIFSDLENMVMDIDSEAHKFLSRATDMFGKNSTISDEDYDKYWYEIHTNLDDKYREISDKSMAIQDIIIAIHGLSEITDAKDKFKDVQTLNT